ncbi:MAG TPA: beta-glucosidase, partial [Leptospiraceae bacterium]|nr:beta-glucosidase [Leptospiraceae bacterium]
MKIKKIIPFLIISFSISATDLTEIRKRALEHASEIVSKMSDEEKAGQVIHIAIPKNYLDEVAIAELQKVRPGGVILFGVNLGKKKEIRALTKGLQ